MCSTSRLSTRLFVSRLAVESETNHDSRCRRGGESKATRASDPERVQTIHDSLLGCGLVFSCVGCWFTNCSAPWTTHRRLRTHLAFVTFPAASRVLARSLSLSRQLGAAISSRQARSRSTWLSDGLFVDVVDAASTRPSSFADAGRGKLCTDPPATIGRSSTSTNGRIAVSDDESNSPVHCGARSWLGADLPRNATLSWNRTSS